ncbi:MAG TPA: pilus assembly PilX N-terminal domain-containing protein [Candidatus Acidoferrales bacterium]|nr:pilus assembly PilX N-terminal domain-containing protein [Candidatus Acidoferrales bacterium]
MKPMRSNNHQQSEKGVALLIAIFALMLISAVAISLVLMSGTGSAIDANYRNSTKAFYNASAGLEEVRGRLAPGRADTIFNALPSPLSVSPTVTVQYVLNPAPGENVTPTVAGSAYADTEFANEWGAALNATRVVQAPLYSDYAPGGVATTIAGLNGPLWKWVRITGLTEASSNTDVDGNGILDAVFPIFEVAGNRFLGSPANLALPQFAGAGQVYRLTSLSVMPDGSRRMLQYDAVMNIFKFNLPAPLTLAGPITNFSPANSNPYHINGQDGSGTAPAVPGCTPNSPKEPAIGTTEPPPAGSTKTNQQYVSSVIPRPANYTGSCSTSPCVSDVSMTYPFDNPTDLDTALQTIQQNANVNLGGGSSYTYSNVVSAMPGGTWPNSSNNPQIIYVDGNFDLGPNTGSGILVVTGNFTYHGNSGWNGLILVVGQGSTTFLGNGGGNGQFDGGILVATTKDSSGNTLSNFGNVNFDISGGGGNGIYYNSCWIQNSTNNLKKFQDLAFREILNF